MSDSTHTECQETNSELESKRLRDERDHYRENVIPDLQAQLDQERQRREQAVALLRACRVHVRHAAKTGTQEQQDAALRLDVNIDALLRRVGSNHD